MGRIKLLLGASLLGMVLGGCVMNPVPKHPEVTGLDEVSNGEVILVGKVVLDPPLSEEQLEAQKDAMPATFGELEGANHVQVGLVENFDPDARYRSLWDMDSMFSAEFGKFFFVKMKRRDFHLVYGWFAIPDAPIASYQDMIALPFGVKVPLSSEDRAVYLGTFRFHRNEFFDIEKAEVVNEMEEARAAFHQRFGKGLDLKQVTLQVPEALQRQRSAKGGD